MAESIWDEIIDEEGEHDPDLCLRCTIARAINDFKGRYPDRGTPEHCYRALVSTVASFLVNAKGGEAKHAQLVHVFAVDTFGELDYAREAQEDDDRQTHPQ